jgi:hypothetical protein
MSANSATKHKPEKNVVFVLSRQPITLAAKKEEDEGES